MIIQLNPLEWKITKDILEPAAKPAAEPATSAAPAPAPTAKAEESIMSTAAVTPAPAESGFKRFIDEVGSFFVHSAPAIEQVAEDAEPFLALSPFGPEYDLVVNAIVGVQKTATASLSTGATMTGAQKMALVLEAVTPGLSAILASKKVTSAVPAAISQFAQNVYSLQTGPSTTVPSTATAPATA